MINSEKTKNAPKRSIKAKAKQQKGKQPNPLHRIVPVGRTLSTKDNYLGKSKTGSIKNRGCVVLYVNNNNELAVVPLSTSSGNNRTEIKGYAKNYIIKNGKKEKATTYFKHYLEIKDSDGNPIVVGEKFRANHKNMDLTKNQVEKIRDKIFNHSKQKERNSKLLTEFKNR